MAGSIHNKNRYLKINFPARWAQEPAKKTSGRNDFHCHRGSNGENPPGLLAHAPAPTFLHVAPPISRFSILGVAGMWSVYVPICRPMGGHAWRTPSLAPPSHSILHFLPFTISLNPSLLLLLIRRHSNFLI